MCHLDEAGFAPTLPTTYSWSAVGERLVIPYEAPQGRRVNVLGAYFSHGPQAGDFVVECRATLPKSRAKKPRKSDAVRAADHDLSPEEVGPIDAQVFTQFLWRLAGRPASAPDDWQRECPLICVLDNYSVHKCAVVQAAGAALAAADVHLFYLPSYSPELSEIEPIWQDVKHRRMVRRSYTTLGELKRAVEEALKSKAESLRKTTNFPPGAA